VIVERRTIGRYVVGFDDSGPARAARAWAQEQASRNGAQLVLRHVAGRRVAQELTRAVRPEDVLVIGTGKTGFVHGRVYGSLGLQVVALARCDVAVVPEVDLRFRSGVVAGIDRQDTADLVASTAAAQAVARRARLQLLQSLPATDQARGAGDLALAAAERAARLGWPELTVSARVVGGPPAQALLDAARNAALLVLGPGGPGHLPGVLGRVTHDVLTNLDAPVLVLVSRPPGERRLVGQDHAGSRLSAPARGVHDQHGAAGVGGAGGADRPDEHADEPSVTAASDDQHAGALAPLDQHPGRCAVQDLAGQTRGRRVPEGLGDGSVQNRPGILLR
jgi:nucleotide-binding universal stress UspA family protein